MTGAAVPICPSPFDSASVSEDLRPYFADHCRDGVFFNPWEVPAEPRFMAFLKWRMTRNPWALQKRTKPQAEVLPDALDQFRAHPAKGRVAWLGHASVLVQLDGITALIDPIFGRTATVIPRWAQAPITVDELPHVDVVMLSHGHYDHLDAPSLRALSKRFGPDLLFATPLGLSRSLPARCSRRVELDWWQSIGLGSLELHLVPAQHWHKRTMTDTNRALWGGWVLRGTGTVYHSGDTGYFGGFRAIGHVFPHIDVASLPIGAWEPRWFMKGQHMSPQESVQALVDMGARDLLAMHWGTFDLTDEPLDEGPRALTLALKELGVAPARAHVLAHGGSLPIHSGGPSIGIDDAT